MCIMRPCFRCLYFHSCLQLKISGCFVPYAPHLLVILRWILCMVELIFLSKLWEFSCHVYIWYHCLKQQAHEFCSNFFFFHCIFVMAADTAFDWIFITSPKAGSVFLDGWNNGEIRRHVYTQWSRNFLWC